MKCPFQAVPYTTWGDTQEPAFCTCREEDCALWDKTSGQCSFRATTDVLGKVLRQIRILSRKLSLEKRDKGK